MSLGFKLIGFCLIHAVFSQSNASLIIEPKTAFIGETTRIWVEGVPHKTEVLIVCLMVDDFHWKWQSNATFLSDSQGRVELGATAPIDGLYSGYDGMGLFWSMIPIAYVGDHDGNDDVILPHGESTNIHAAEQRKNDFIPFASNPIYCWGSQDVTPLVYNFYLYVAGELVANNTFAFQRISSDIYQDDNEFPVQMNGYSLHGYLARPYSHDRKGEPPTTLPAILLLEDAGVSSYSRVAAPLASKLGCVVFALAYYGAKGLPLTPTNIPLEYFQAALEWLGARTYVDETRIAIHGSSKGGEAALAVASAFPQLVAAVVVSVGSGIAFENSWTLNGVLLPSLQSTDADTSCLERARTGNPDLYSLSRFYCMLANRDAATAAEIHVENIQCPILFQSSGYDLYWPSSYLTQVSVNRLNRLPPSPFSSPSSSSSDPSQPSSPFSNLPDVIIPPNQIAISATYFWSNNAYADDDSSCTAQPSMDPFPVRPQTSLRLHSLNGLGVASMAGGTHRDELETGNASRPLFTHVDYYGAGHVFLPPYMPTSGYAGRCWQSNNLTYCGGGSSDISIAAAMVDWFGQQLNFLTNTIIVPPQSPPFSSDSQTPFDVLDKKVLLACCVGFVLLSVVLTGMFIRLRHQLKSRSQRHSRQLTTRFIS